MERVTSIKELQQILKEARKKGKTIGLVPTMGYFHEGHLSLMRRAKLENDVVVVSLFVNPTQFGPNEDLDKYPRDLERDQTLAATVGVDLLFHPEAAEIYPPEFQTFVEVTGISQGMCGSARPGHFRGVTTVVLKLFNIVNPDRAYFGEKDAQQLRVIKQMVHDLNLDLQIVAVPIVREEDGLAMSSRNVYLKPEERRAALILNNTLDEARKLITAGERNPTILKQLLLAKIQSEPLAEMDYLAIVESATLKPLNELKGEILIALAVKIGATRLIDNITLKVGA